MSLQIHLLYNKGIFWSRLYRIMTGNTLHIASGWYSTEFFGEKSHHKNCENHIKNIKSRRRHSMCGGIKWESSGVAPDTSTRLAPKDCLHRMCWTWTHLKPAHQNTSYRRMTTTIRVMRGVNGWTGSWIVQSQLVPKKWWLHR